MVIALRTMVAWLLAVLWLPASSHLLLEQCGITHAIHEAHVGVHGLAAPDSDSSPRDSAVERELSAAARLAVCPATGCHAPAHEGCLDHGHHPHAPGVSPAGAASWSPPPFALPDGAVPTDLPNAGTRSGCVRSPELGHRLRSWAFLLRAVAPARAPSPSSLT